MYSNSTDSDHVTIGNPAPVYLPNSDTVFLPFCRNSIQVYYTTSTDGGASSQVEEYPEERHLMVSFASFHQV